MTQTNACPECDRGGAEQRADGKWRCKKCGAIFDSPHIREQYQVTRNSPAARLERMDPEEVSL